MKSKKSTGLEPIYGLLAHKIRHVRETLGVTQEELAKRVEYTRVSMVNIETGRQRISLHMVDEIARALGTSPKHLLRGIWF